MIGTFLLTVGLSSMAILFGLSLVLYKKDKRMELAVMGFALAAALAISGVTATVRDRAKARRAEAADAEAAQSAQSAEAVAALANATWFSQPDGTYVHADGTSADAPRTDAPAVPDMAPNPSEPAPMDPEPPQSAPAPGAADGPAQNTPEEPIPA